MLREHLNPEHDAASRRPTVIDEQVRWLHEEVLGGERTRILDLGCGPGLYGIRLAKLGHDVTGVDISPASLDYARKSTANVADQCRFVQGDFRSATVDGEFGLVMQIYGELNVFRREQAREIVSRYAKALVPGGRLLFEVDRPETTREFGHSPLVWRSWKQGLFSDRPHVYLEESFWNEEQRTATKRYWILDAQTADVARFAQSFAAYEADEYREMLSVAGLVDIELQSDYPKAVPNGNKRRWMLIGTKRT